VFLCLLRLAGVGQPGHLAQRPRHGGERGREIRQPHEREQKPRDPEGMVVRKEREQPQHGHELVLYLFAAVRQLFGQRMQSPVDQPDADNENQQEDRSEHQQRVRIAGLRDEDRQMVRRSRIHCRCCLFHKAHSCRARRL
jgi:hypothetical protein